MVDKMVRFEFINACLGYQNKVVLSNISTVIEPGEITCLLGPNGVGKTTLFKTILGFIPSLSGQVLLNGQSIESYSSKAIAHLIAYVPQAHNTPFPYQVIDVVLFGRTAHLNVFGSPKKQDREIAFQNLELLGIAHLSHRPFSELSGGERQMVIIARALTQEASFIILDEPTSNLDYGNKVRIIQTIKKLKEKSIGILMATHSPNHAFMLGSKVILFERGFLYRSGYPEHTVTNENLERIYGVKVQIFNMPESTDNPGYRLCTPIIN